MSKEQGKPYTAKKLTSYRRWILKAYNAESAKVTDEEFCKQHRIKKSELHVWQVLAGQELAEKLKELKVSEQILAKRSAQRSIETASRDFYEECAKVIEITGGERKQRKTERSTWQHRCERARYRLLQKIASLPVSDSNYRRFTRMRGEL